MYSGTVFERSGFYPSGVNKWTKPKVTWKRSMRKSLHSNYRRH